MDAERERGTTPAKTPGEAIAARPNAMDSANRRELRMKFLPRVRYPTDSECYLRPPRRCYCKSRGTRELAQIHLVSFCIIGCATVSRARTRVRASATGTTADCPDSRGFVLSVCARCWCGLLVISAKW